MIPFRTLLYLALLPAAAPWSTAAETAGPAASGWDEAAVIVARIKPPVFPARDFRITDFGALAGGESDCTNAIRQAIEACQAAGGGRVVVPPGVFLTGAIHLRSNVELHVSEGATLRFSTAPAAYLPVVYTRWEGIECLNFSPLIYAFEQENIAVTGSGTLDGGATESNWWAWPKAGPDGKSLQYHDNKRLNEMSEQGLPVDQRVLGAGFHLRPNFLQPYRCRNVLVDGLTIVNSPMWEIHPVLCTNVIVRNLKIVSHGPNNDGCNPESSRDVLVENCRFDVGDDCMALKSGRNDDGRRVGVATENIVIRGCTMKDGHGGVSIGSEIAGGCRNVFIEDCRMDSPNLDRALRLKSNARRGGVVENIYMRRVEIGRVSEALLTVDFLYEEGSRGKFPPTVRNIFMENITSHASPRLFFLNGFEGATIDNIHLSHSRFEGVESCDVIEYAGRILLDDVAVIPARRVRSLNSRQLVE